MALTHFDIIVTGKVQGVFYRDSTKAVADQLGVKGTIKNAADGSVVIEAEGSEIILDEFLDWCREGPERAVVEAVKTAEGDLKNYRNFEVIKK